MPTSPAWVLMLAAGLPGPAHRREAARALARQVGAEDIVLFVPDPETGAPLPAPGFPQTIPQRGAWRAFLAECGTAGCRTGDLPHLEGATPTRAAGIAVGDGSVLVLLGGAPAWENIADVAAVLPLLTWTLRAERDVHTARGQAAAARQATVDARALTDALDTAVGETEAATTAAEEAAAALRASEERYHSLFEDTRDAILVADADGRYPDANAAAARLLEYTHDHLRQLRVAEVVVATSGWTETEYERFKREGQWRGERELRRQDGSIVPVEARATVVDLPTGAVYLSAIRDVSERRALERMQREFLSMVTHELRTPLASIKGYAQIMQKRAAYNESAVGVIVTQAKRLERLIGDLLDVSRLEVGRLELQRDVTDLVALTREHMIRVEGPESLLIGRWDTTRLEQVLQNLLSNAVKYSPDGGVVVVRVEAPGQAYACRSRTRA
jgi:PAS domain S-box-containing protein